MKPPKHIPRPSKSFEANKQEIQKSSMIVGIFIGVGIMLLGKFCIMYLFK